MTFTSPRPVGALLMAIEQEAAEADAAFQIAQQRDWNQLVQGRALLAGYDRLTNLGLAEVRIAVGLTAVRPSPLRRTWSRIIGRTQEPTYWPAMSLGVGAPH